MPLLNVQTVFLFYSALSILCGITLVALFYGKDDQSARLWVIGCILAATSACVTVFRDYINLLFSYCLMIGLWTLGAFIFCESFKALSSPTGKVKLKPHIFLIPTGIFVIEVLLLEDAGGRLTSLMAGISAFSWMLINIYTVVVLFGFARNFKSKFLLKILIFLFIFDALLYLIRIVNISTGYSPFAFDPKPFNLFIYFVIAVVSSLKGLTYIVLRMHMSFVDYRHLNSMNMQLSNIIQERNDMIASLQKFNKSTSVNALASTVAHEVNQPLGASKIDAELALYLMDTNPENSSGVRKALASMVKNLDRAKDIIRNLSSLSKGSQVHNESVIVGKVLSSVIQVAMSRAKAACIQIHQEPFEVCSVFANPGELEQVFANILNNALDELESCSQESKDIRISINKNKSNVIISFADNGRGISVDQSSKIFDLLYTTKSSGSGIGLWISKEIVEKIGGSLKCCPGTDAGSIFMVTIPLEKAK